MKYFYYWSLPSVSTNFSFDLRDTAFEKKIKDFSETDNADSAAPIGGKM